MKTLQGVIKPVLGILALESGEASSLNLQGARGRNVCRYSSSAHRKEGVLYVHYIQRAGERWLPNSGSLGKSLRNVAINVIYS